MKKACVRFALTVGLKAKPITEPHWRQTIVRAFVALATIVPLDASDSVCAQTTTRVSISSTGVQGNGLSDSPSISANGRFVAFQSIASNLVSGDTNGSDDIFVYDRQTGQVTRVSVPSTGEQGNGFGGSKNPSICANGRYVAFHSWASNLVIGDTNNASDVFVHDLQSRQTMRVSVSSAGMQGNHFSEYASISADGRQVAFQSKASILVPDDTNVSSDVFVHDRQTGQTTRVSISSTGEEGNGGNGSTNPSISADGRFVAFHSWASNLIANDTNVYPDVFVHDRLTGQTACVSVSDSGAQGFGPSWFPSISADGQFVAFHSDAYTFVPGDTNSSRDIFVHDRETARTTRVSISTSGAQSSGNSDNASISVDGRCVAFRSYANNLVAGDTNLYPDAFVHDRQAGQTTLISESSSALQSNSYSDRPAISADCRYVAFTSWSSNLVSDDTNGTSDIFVRDRGPLAATPGVVTAPTPPAYDVLPPPGPGQNKLIVITHGWNTKPTNNDYFKNFWLPLGDAIRSELSPDWQVHVCDWTSDSGDPFPDFLIPFSGSGEGPDYALQMAIAHGASLGVEIGLLHYEHVHLIAHSAGSSLIATAAFWIKQYSLDTTVHTTYLDATAGTFNIDGVGDYQQSYGGNSAWSDHYFSRERELTTWWCWPPLHPSSTGLFTQNRLQLCYNLDVSLVDPGYNSICFSSHGWPNDFFQNSLTREYGVYGWPLGLESFSGSVQDWITNRNTQCPRNGWFSLPAGSLAGGDGSPESNLVFRRRQDSPLDLSTIPSYVSSAQAVQIAPNGFTATTQPKGANESAPAWVNFQMTTTMLTNFIMFDLQFTSDPPAAGLLTVYVNGIKRGVVDEVYTLPGTSIHSMPTPGDLQPAQHIVSFRLDQFGALPSSLAISSVRTGRGAFVRPGDVNVDDVVNIDDLVSVITGWGQCPAAPAECPADANGDGAVNIDDLVLVITSWG